MRIAPVLLTLLVGCIPSSEDATRGDMDPDDDIDTDTDPDPVVPPAPVAAGTYQVRTQVDLTVETVLPERAADLVVTLRDFSDNPAHTLMDVAEDAGVPAVAELREALPDYVETKLEGWINEEIAKLAIGGVPVTQFAANVAALAETALTQFAIDSELTIDGASSTHRLTNLDLSPTGLDHQFALDAVPANVVSATLTCASTEGQLAIGDHGYAIAYGEYVWQALDRNLTAEYGSGLRSILGTAVDCPALASRISTKCVWGYCVGHQAELTAICERGLDEVVERVHAKVAGLRFDALHLAAGSATIVDGGLDHGVWTAELNVGQGLRHVPATFTATK